MLYMALVIVSFMAGAMWQRLRFHKAVTDTEIEWLIYYLEKIRDRKQKGKTKP